MKVMVARGAGLDVHKKTVVACRRRYENKEVEQETRTFGTMTADLLALSDWLGEWEVTTVAMESTGEYWKPVFNLLEGTYEVLVVNAKHIKYVPGRKTDVKDAEWIAELLSYGLLKGSFVPKAPQRALRDLTRYRVKLVQERAREVNRVQKLLESANIKLASVASNVFGVSGRLMLEALIEGKSDPETMAELAKGRLRNKLPQLEKALTGVVNDHHRFLLGEQLSHIDYLDEQVERIGNEISQRMQQMSQPPTPSSAEQTTETVAETDGVETTPSWTAAVALLDSVPGINERAAEMILAEIGVDMAQFPSADHLTAWAGLAPGNNQSGGKRFSGRTRKGNRTIKTIMTQVAHAAVKKKGSYASAKYRRLAMRRGKKRAIVAVARSLMVSIYHMLTNGVFYEELGSDYFDNRNKERKTNYLLKQLGKLGYDVHLEPNTPVPLTAG